MCFNLFENEQDKWTDSLFRLLHPAKSQFLAFQGVGKEKKPLTKVSFTDILELSRANKTTLIARSNKMYHLSHCRT